MIEQKLTIELPPEGDPDALAEWYAENEMLLSELVRTVYRVKRHIEGRIREQGPIATSHGLLDLEPAGFAWDERAVAQAMPALAKARSATISGPPADVERALSLVTEDVPSVTVTGDSWTIDKTAAARAIDRGTLPPEVTEGWRQRKQGKLEVR